MSPNGEIQSNFWQSGAEVELENVRAQEWPLVWSDDHGKDFCRNSGLLVTTDYNFVGMMLIGRMTKVRCNFLREAKVDGE